MSDPIRFYSDQTPINVEGGDVFALSYPVLGVLGMLPFGAPTVTRERSDRRASLADPMVVSERAHESMLEELHALRARVAALEAVVQQGVECDCREITNRQAKAEIAAYFRAHHGEDLYPSDVARALSLPYDQVSALMEKLSGEGKIGPARQR